ncbi:unnamed protein product [Candidula unifasciata]|uniref:RING-type domain-containing protein n=1 Tax=Candidula unifasciata TaxID=100452 RepID=A0A8S3ZV81_9EUPU|nr:unnamed protein product [Candidula unifasciata]
MLQTLLMLAVPTLFTLTAVLYTLSCTERPGRELLMNRRTGRKVTTNTPNSHIGECVVCFEETYMVLLYPCQHSTVCLRCVAEIIASGSGECPLCRSQIQGYSEVF